MQREWIHKVRGDCRRNFAFDRAFVYFTGSKLVSLDPDTGKERAKVKWQPCGEPWADDTQVWVPTRKGLSVYDAATLEQTNEILTPKPKEKGERIGFFGTLAGIHGERTIRVGKNGGRADGVHRFYLTISEFGAKKPGIQRLLGEAKGMLGAYRSGVALVADKEGATVTAISAEDGEEIARTESKEPILWVRVEGDALMAVRRDFSRLVFSGDGLFHEIPAVPRFEKHAGTLLGFTHRELRRYDERWTIAARRASITPSGGEVTTNYRVPTSVIAAGKRLRSVERVAPIPTEWKHDPKPAPLEYETRTLDPKTLEQVGSEERFEAPPWFFLRGHVGSRLIAATHAGFEAYRTA